ncbi:BAG family molecular chaperone regulator 2-like [Apostichopus japonicus]|uniref:BAG family molecular chaperone regulator 2-like n=1 Tax=Stichopus japonicus TaxID=307972 RepID=UPI003AB3C6BE
MANNHLSLMPVEDLTRDRIQETLDSLENGVDKMRELARVVKEDREAILNSLGSLLNSPILKDTKGAEREEIELRLDHLVKRCLGVEIEVQIIRNQSQQLAMERVTEILESLVDSAHSDLRRTKTVAQRYLNSCLTEPKGPTDEGFQATLLECAADDQKEIRKKLQILLDKMEAMSGILSSFDPKLA